MSAKMSDISLSAEQITSSVFPFECAESISVCVESGCRCGDDPTGGTELKDGIIYVSHLKPKPDLCPCFQRGGRHQTLRHLQDHHRLRVRRALQPLLVPQRPGASLQERLLDPTQRPAECKSSLPGPGPLSEPDPAPQMNPPPALRDTNQGGEKKLNFHSNALEKQKKKKL